jgi:hypothetical protein
MSRLGLSAAAANPAPESEESGIVGYSDIIARSMIFRAVDRLTVPASVP